ncbi:MAG: hypothetical protein LBG44_04340 [Gemmatimonadota bacterium]|nr:hypothetical protein [Gemmatimonadota bacterium]
MLFPVDGSGDPIRATAARGRNRLPLLLVVALLPGLLLAHPASAQLRPWEPFDWSLFDEGRVSIAMGTSVLADQRASLAGTQGLLIEAGMFSGGVRIDRVGVEAAGTLYRQFRERTVFAAPSGGAEERPIGTRHDAGDYRISTGIALTRPDRRATFLLRFGSRLPTTDNRVGLERDAIDFFATFGARITAGPARAFGELGVGIHGTRIETFEQSDLLIYMLGVESRTGLVRPGVVFLGQTISRSLWFRGTEPLSEVRLKVDAGGGLSLRLEAIHGLAEFSPGNGISASLLATF